MGGRGRPPLQMWYTFDLINPLRAVGDTAPYIVNARFACSNFITIKFIACGAAFTAAVMFESQCRPLDMRMYYDARPCAMNGIFTTDYVCERLKGYYPFRMFNELVKLGESVKTESVCYKLFSCAAKGENSMAFVVSYFDDNDNADEMDVKISFENMDSKKRKVSYYLLDENHNEELVRDETVTGESISSYLKMPLFSAYLIKIEEI